MSRQTDRQVGTDKFKSNRAFRAFLILEKVGEDETEEKKEEKILNTNTKLESFYFEQQTQTKTKAQRKTEKRLEIKRDEGHRYIELNRERARVRDTV